MEIPFQVPADLLKLTLTLRGTVTPATGGEPQKLSANQAYEINGDLKEARIGSAFFSPTTEGHRLEVRGRNGEPLPSRAITLAIRRDDFAQKITLQVRTYANGQVQLGELANIDNLNATGTDIGTPGYSPELHTLSQSVVLKITAGSEIRIPL